MVLALLLAVILYPLFTSSFVPPASHRLIRARGGQALYDSTDEEHHDGNAERNLFLSLDKARLDFELLFEEELKPKLMTSSSRRRQEVEMELLKTLEDSDDAIDELVFLWLSERDAESTQLLQEMEKGCSDGLFDEEERLRNMITKHGIEWTEPLNRLATLLYFKGNSLESMVWCEIVLQEKPWHFEAAHLQLMNAFRLCQPLLPAARRRLPPLNPRTNHRARRKWVQNALKQASRALKESDEELNKLGDGIIWDIREEENAWQ